MIVTANTIEVKACEQPLITLFTSFLEGSFSDTHGSNLAPRTPVAECMEAYMDRSRKLATLGEVRQYQSSSWKLEKLGLEPGELAMGHCRMSGLG